MSEARFDTSGLRPGVWFVRSRKGGGFFPVTPEGNRITLLFLVGMLGSAALGGILAAALGNHWFLAVSPLGMAASGWWFIDRARRHGDRSVNVMDILVKG